MEMGCVRHLSMQNMQHRKIAKGCSKAIGQVNKKQTKTAVQRNKMVLTETVAVLHNLVKAKPSLRKEIEVEEVDEADDDLDEEESPPLAKKQKHASTRRTTRNKNNKK